FSGPVATYRPSPNSRDSRLKESQGAVEASGRVRSRRAPTSHRQNHAELRFAAHHARVALSRFFEWIRFNHGTHAGEFGEAQRILGISWRSGGPPLNRFNSEN